MAEVPVRLMPVKELYKASWPVLITTPRMHARAYYAADAEQQLQRAGHTHGVHTTTCTRGDGLVGGDRGRVRGGTAPGVRPYADRARVSGTPVAPARRCMVMISVSTTTIVLVVAGESEFRVCICLSSLVFHLSECA